MKKKAIISVSSKQVDNEIIEVVTPGNFYRKDDSYYAVYEETELSGMEGTTTTLRIKDNKFSLIRMGSTSTKMDFNKDKGSVSIYKTPYGTVELKIETSKLNINVNEAGGDVFVNYSMSAAGQAPQNTQLKINIKTQD
ncbi:DUF1934 domain-containing protein [Clostridium kluyveri]|uniref:DUF1934 domain-containing protein n=2 Tax=Clostridium kluyveri TaxID=1534 RepID=A5N3K6_CLOK5|nr:DUF1934 domain-containing protein [Clostridium kluyveri]EDK35702.1 Conserved hypothetical protein [Clostridium kluyveri DSM 555]BAH08333.1 hypothetical protein CKR_3282 [Clostridium kluyveri NBRC 12016]